MKHTPGPWRCVSGAVETTSGVPIASMDREHGNGTLPVERDCNARLITVAPELLEALVAILPYAEAEAESLAEVCRKFGDEGVRPEADRAEKACDLAHAAVTKAASGCSSARLPADIRRDLKSLKGSILLLENREGYSLATGALLMKLWSRQDALRKELREAAE